ncbi:MAG: hypothetical protein JSR60_13680 [Proteobacteria bacterium]|nr:hypothetical protein [Pseudomonadota bacterium]
MRLTRYALAALLLSATPVLADPPPAGGGMMGGHGSAMHGMFTPEERMMMFVDGMKATAGMTDDQKKAYRDKRRTDIMAMSDSDRAKFKADLDTRWNALPDDKKAEIKSKIMAFMAAHHHDGGQ